MIDVKIAYMKREPAALDDFTVRRLVRDVLRHPSLDAACIAMCKARGIDLDDEERYLKIFESLNDLIHAEHARLVAERLPKRVRRVQDFLAHNFDPAFIRASASG